MQIKRSASRKPFVGASSWKGKDREEERARREKIPKKGSDISHGMPNQAYQDCLLSLSSLSCFAKSSFHKNF
ncbi:hypothetical protein CR513_20794, partial [Mucuna pruriens]